MVKRVKAPEKNLIRSAIGHLRAISEVTKQAIKPGTITISYPHERRKLPDYFRGFILFEKEECISCFRCAHICPANAIQMYADQEGRYYPGVDYAKCIFCHFCVDSCPTAALKPSKIHDVAFKDVESMMITPEQMEQVPEIEREDKVTVEYDFDGDVKLIRRKEVEELTVKFDKPKRPRFVAAPLNAENCIGCRLCMFSCPVDAIKSKVEEVKVTLETDYEKCTGCGICVRICPTEVLKLTPVKGGEV
ncbi:4Fe-4S ferredoxin iron-sulfur binding domain protein [Ferroglobus placidus DSM 10642]|uniref:4Fe-4S ferredoxin iron-sulfur binding domain protein n=1 Tax=Ferroglobus placidus (strain DSM 10642 / AEDII12DO) TaxID=589924 RepID=D3RZE3_FERPA|nr:4Fe-4S binding protein [Ferroglobus placidus]ADC65856.1 4Fe-4S ferredoxin iron-sulfur binding domain protein [Ferroglobus placidus DSM 10642]